MFELLSWDEMAWPQRPLAWLQPLSSTLRDWRPLANKQEEMNAQVWPVLSQDLPR